MFQSSDASQRAAAFYDLTRVGCPACQHSAFPVVDGLQNAIHFGTVEKKVMAQNLIALLSRESAAQQNTTSLSPEYCEYLGDLVQAVSFLRDTRSIPALFAFLNSGNMVEDALAALGDDSLSRVQAILDAPVSDDMSRTSAVRVIRKMAQQKNLKRFSNPENSRAAIKAALIKALGEPVYFSRIEAVWGLAELGEKDTLDLIQNVATNDSYSDAHPNTIGLPYPVRLEAQKALDSLKSK